MPCCQRVSLSIYYLCVVPKVVENLKMSDFLYKLGTGLATITDYTGKGGDIVVPAEIDGHPVIIIGYRAFSFWDSITSIELPPGVIAIGESAFANCTGLTSIDLPMGLRFIGEDAFYRCTGLTSIDLPGSITTIENETFRNCTGLTSIFLPKGLTTIGESAFRDCTSLTEVVLPHSLAHIRGGAFDGCTNLVGLTLHHSKTDMEEAWCEQVAKGVDLPEQVALREAASARAMERFHAIDAPIGEQSPPANLRKIIRNLKVGTVRELSKRSAQDIMRSLGSGPKTVHYTDVWLASFGLRLERDVI